MISVLSSLTEAILLGFQHFIVMLGTTVIIPTALFPQMGGGNEEKAKVVQPLLFVAGINTLLQTLFGSRLPAIIGGSYTFVALTISIILSNRWNDQDPMEVGELKRRNKIQNLRTNGVRAETNGGPMLKRRNKIQNLRTNGVRAETNGGPMACVKSRDQWWPYDMCH